MKTSPNLKPGLKLIFAVTAASLIPLAMSGCGGPKAFTQGSYDDPERVELLDDKYNEADMQQMADEVTKAMVACKFVANAPMPPVVIVDPVQNRTEEHIDTEMLTEKISATLINTGKVRFVDKKGRGSVQEEYDYNAGGNVSGPTQKKGGKQIGADYILRGAIATNIQEVGNDKFIYYKLNMGLTNMETTTKDCVAEKQIRKKYRKRSVGL